MKKILFLLAVPALAFLASCGGGTDDVKKPIPTVTFDASTSFVGADRTFAIDEVIKFKMVAVSNDKKLKNLSISLSTNGGASGRVKDSVVSSGSASLIYTVKLAGNGGDKLTYSFTATDDNGTTESKSITITLAPKAVALNSTSNQQIFNIKGAEPGAYDLNKGLPVVAASPSRTKDLLDLTGANLVWNGSYGSGHGTSKFVKVSNSDYTNASSTSDLFTLWNNNAAVATSTLTNVAINEIVLIKTGQLDVPFDYYILKVTAVSNTPAVGNNSDNITFSYKGLGNF